MKRHLELMEDQKKLHSVSASESVTKNESEQNFLSSMPYHTAFAFLIPLLIGILGVYAQGRKNLFETNSTNIWIFLVNTLFYGFALAADLKYQHHQTIYSQFISPVAIISGSLSSSSVVSILLGDITFALWAFVPVILAYQHATSIKNAYNLLLQKIKSSTFSKNSYNWLHQKMNWGILIRFKGSSSVIEQPQLPV